ncbi:MAG: nicotinate (nicotinamide) nucleotide adenylyltransferase [Ruminococcaceae bacterium]|nr:nicotinate (nicotinamide) nucleotide adenylyltransferase [Oscillospiraceae bacterium]
MKIGLFGGSFDPIHEGHLALVHAAADALGLDRVILMPTGMPPHKVKVSSTADADRLAMCRLAVQDDPLAEVSDYEIRQGGASFTVDTLTYLTEEHPEDTFYLLMGADMFLTLLSWKRFEDIVEMAVLCTVPRDDEPIDKLEAYAKTYETLGADCRVLPMPLRRISSTQIRECAQSGRSLEGLVPKAVAQYIVENGLYRAAGDVDRNEQFKDIIRARLTPARYEHSLAVAAEAKRLAIKWGADPDKAYTAGLLHDILKNTKPELQLQILQDFGILLDTAEQASKKLWHAICGAAFIERVLGVKDPEILTAVRYHTTARAGMGLLERVLYLADFTSADRDYDDVDVMRRLVDEDPEEAMMYALGYTIRELTEKNAPIHPDTIGAYNELALKRSVT